MEVSLLWECKWSKIPRWSTSRYTRTYGVFGLSITDNPASKEYRQAREMALMAVWGKLEDDFAAGDEDAAQWKPKEAVPINGRWLVCADKKGA